MVWSFFIIGGFVLPNLFFWWWADRRVRGRTVARIALGLFMLFAICQAAWIVVEPESARAAHDYLPRWWMVVAYLWHLMALPASLVAIGIGALARLVLRRRRNEPAADPSRRRLLAACAGLAAPVAAGAAGVVALTRLDEFRVRRLRVPVPGLPDELSGMRIAQVADLHYGKYTKPETIGRIVETVNGLRADLVLSTGDLIDLSLRDLPDAIETAKRFDGPLYLCEGNHDLIDDGEEFRSLVRDAGLGLLLDEEATVEVRGRPVQVLGARWGRGRGGRRETLRRVAALKRDDRFPILLAHHPHVFDDAEGFPLTLSGHTHGGQLMWNERLGAGPILFRYWSGLYRKDDRVLAVSNGIGNWFPLRTRAPAEVLLLTLEQPIV